MSRLSVTENLDTLVTPKASVRLGITSLRSDGDVDLVLADVHVLGALND